MSTFEEMGLNADLIKGLHKKGITTPTAIQAQAIPFLLQNHDLIGQSQTGSGKTLAFLLPLFQKINTEKREMQALILAPTHELAMQINSEVKNLAENSGVPVTSLVIIGDVNITRQVEALREKPHIIVGSVGRIQELIGKKKISAHTIKTIVIDEGDRLLDQDDVNRVKAVIKTTMKDRQLMVFAAHIDGEALEIAKELMNQPEVVKIEKHGLVNAAITHVYFEADGQRGKFDLLRKLIAAYNPQKAIIFVNNSEDIQKVTDKLQYHHYNAHKILGKVSKEERQRALEGFRGEDTQLLVASDLAARGLDIKGITHIFNLDLPEEAMEYMHRAGRTGRHNQLGVTASIISERELAIIKRYEKELAIKIEKKGLYGGAVIDQGIGRQINRSKA